jgi:hypothetical protein
MSGKKALRAVPPKEQRERDRKARNRQLWHQHAITESFIDRLLESSGPIEEWERDFLSQLVDSNAWQRFEAKDRLLRA